MTSQASTPHAVSASGLAGVRRIILERPTYLIFAAVTLFFIIFAPNFATLRTAEAIFRITALVTIMAVGMTFVIVCAEIDLSVGSVASWSGMVVALLIDRGAPGWLAPILVLGMGAAIGVVNGLLVTKVGIPSFLVTLGMLSVFSGLALTITGTEPVPIVDDFFTNVFWNANFLDIPAPILWTIVAVIIGFYVLQMTVFGRQVYAVGGNFIAARFSGLKTDRIKIIAFVASGLTASLAGMMLAARSTAGNPSLGSGLELDVIAAVIIGGTSLFGGVGGIIGSVIGAIFIGILGFGLLVMGLSTSIQEVVKGAIIILAVALNRR